MKYLLFLVLLLFGVISKAQYISPLDSIPKSKKGQLMKIGENTSVDLLAGRTLRLFKLAFDSLQTKTKAGYYKIPNMRADSTKSKVVGVPIDIINSLSKQEFAEHLLAIYADSLTETQLIQLNKAFETEDGIRYKEFLRKVVNDEPIKTDYSTTSFFNDIDNYNTFFMMSGITGYIAENMMLILFSYIEEKSYTYD
ncbi:hypothetical protein DU508_19915 [Pedobacter chinensis]|uniref:Uncharacterized protein n=1 Tax=Pedobacter chinensis TaxID=2282421 RepID=A0A369PR29_9SPHI|nr:hypothetical protein [Pedobacter chinensis]RDC54772.1 hypothetical protein DU508_19915 [Pedobacter chinensis]